jgi:dUTP pyrophosphatase
MALSNNVMDCDPKDLDWMGAFTKSLKTKPTLVPTGVKCKLEPGTYLELSVRSSSPLKYWLFLANGVGIIDSDYYNNPDNEGHIYFQMINLSPFPIKIKKGEAIGQGIIHRFCITEDDNATGLREGGFGSTNK